MSLNNDWHMEINKALLLLYNKYFQVCVADS